MLSSPSLEGCKDREDWLGEESNIRWSPKQVAFKVLSTLDFCHLACFYLVLGKLPWEQAGTGAESGAALPAQLPQLGLRMGHGWIHVLSAINSPSPSLSCCFQKRAPGPSPLASFSSCHVAHRGHHLPASVCPLLAGAWKCVYILRCPDPFKLD